MELGSAAQDLGDTQHRSVWAYDAEHNKGSIDNDMMEVTGDDGYGKNEKLKKTGLKRQKLHRWTDGHVQETRSIPRFLIVSSFHNESSFCKVSPFKLHKELISICGALKNIKKLRNGSLLIECMTDIQSSKLQAIQSLCDLPVKVEPHKYLNYCKGVITCSDLLNVSLDEIKNELQSYNVVDAWRLPMRRDGQRVDSASIVLTFELLTLPSTIRAGFHQLKVRSYTPPPVQCFECFRFGHVKKFCKSKPLCPLCGKDRHEGDCTSPLLCVNCKGQHSARSRDCPKYKTEQEIMDIRTRDKISYGEAQHNYQQFSSPIFSRSFATVATTGLNPIKSCGCQCTCSSSTKLSAKPSSSFSIIPKNNTAPRTKGLPPSSRAQVEEPPRITLGVTQEPLVVPSSSRPEREENPKPLMTKLGKTKATRTRLTVPTSTQPVREDDKTQQLPPEPNIDLYNSYEPIAEFGDTAI